MSIKKIVYNSGILYTRMLLVMFITLYTTRLLLKNLGVEGFGLYSVISSFVVLGAFITGILTTASQRFISESLAKGKEGQVAQTFKACFTVHVFLAMLVFIILEITGVIYLKHQLVQHVATDNTVQIIFQCSLLVFIISIICSLFSAVFIAEEDMSVYSKISVFDVILKFIIAFSLTYFKQNELVIYSLLIVFESVLVLLISIGVILFRYKQYKLCISRDIDRIKNILSFVLWSVWGGVATVLNNQGINLLLNSFFGLYVNAARTISLQLNSAFLQVINSVLMAVNPQLVKAYSSENELYFKKLLIISSKIVSILAIIMFVVLYNNTKAILEVWLYHVPDYTVLFVQLILIDVFINTLSAPMILAVQASGRIKLYQTVVGGLLILNLPLAYLCLLYTKQPEFVYYTSIAFSVLTLLARVTFTRLLLKIDLWSYLYQVILKGTVILFLVTVVMRFLIPATDSFWVFALYGFTTCIITLVIFLFIGLENKERQYSISWLKLRISKKG